MAIKEYREFVLSAEEVEKDPQGLRQIATEVIISPAGEGKREIRPIPADLPDKLLFRLENRKLDVAGIISLGEVLADLLLPGQARQLFTNSLGRLKPGQGLRLRLRLAPELAGIPWEYMYIQPGSGEKDATGFLALNPRLSVVRHEALPVPGDLDLTPRPRRLLAALASPEEPGYDPLDLAQEGDDLEKALKDVPGIELDLLEPATVQGLSDKLRGGADIFHFAGHGGFKQTGLGGEIGSILGQGEIFLVDAAGGAAPWPADQLAVNLRGHGVQLAVLGACQTGRRDGQNVWSGVVAALLEAGLPAVVAMQYKIWDEAAVAFSRSLYQALAVGLSLDEAVSAGRLAAFNLAHPSRDDAIVGKFWRDWGVPVLYLRSEQTFVLPAITDAREQKEVMDKLDNVFIKVKKIITEVGGEDIVVKVGEMTEGGIDVVENISKIKRGAQSIAELINNLGKAPAPAEIGLAAEPAPTSLTCPKCNKPVEANWKFCPHCQADLALSRKMCSQCRAEIPAGAKFCPQCRAPLS